MKITLEESQSLSTSNHKQNLKRSDSKQELLSLRNKIMEELDKEKKSPSDRALKIYTLLKKYPDLTDWDLICFCAEYLASQSINLTYLKKPALELIHLVYNQHYMLGQENGK